MDMMCVVWLLLAIESLEEGGGNAVAPVDAKIGRGRPGFRRYCCPVEENRPASSPMLVGVVGFSVHIVERSVLF